MSLVPRLPTHPLERVELYCSSVGLKGGCWCYTTPHTKAKPGLQLSNRGEIKSSSKEELTKTWPNELPNRWRHNKIFLVRQVPMKKKSSSLSYVLSSGRKALTPQALWWIFYQVWFRPWWTWHLSSRKPPRSGNEKALDGMTLSMGPNATLLYTQPHSSSRRSWGHSYEIIARGPCQCLYLQKAEAPVQSNKGASQCIIRVVYFFSFSTTSSSSAQQRQLRLSTRGLWENISWLIPYRAILSLVIPISRNLGRKESPQSSWSIFHLTISHFIRVPR